MESLLWRNADPPTAQIPVKTKTQQISSTALLITPYLFSDKVILFNKH